jgi:D-alanyl-D-alanine carboxypeptidase
MGAIGWNRSDSTGTRTDTCGHRRVRFYAIPLVLTMALQTTACTTEAGEPRSTSPSVSPTPALDFEQMIEGHAKEYDAGVIAFVESDGETWRGAAGQARGGRQAAPGDLFDFGSIAKTFLAVVVLQLVEEGRLSLDDSVERWLPGQIREDVLVRHLLNHTSGLSDLSARPFKVTSTPGTIHRYANVNAWILAQIVKKVTGRSALREETDRILKPLHLTHTSFGIDPDGLDDGPWLGHKGPYQSTTSDLARFFRALMRGRLLGDEMLAEMMTTVPAGGNLYAGLGIFRADLPCGSAWGHGGESRYTTQVWVSEDGSTSIVVARNTVMWWSLEPFSEDLFCAAMP